MSRINRTILVVGCLALAGAASQAQPPGAPVATQTVAEIRIDLPPGTEQQVAIHPGIRQLSVELPRGAIFPLDLQSASGGLLRGGEVTPLDDERVELRLELAGGQLDRAVFDADALVLHFVSRFSTQGSGVQNENPYLLGADDKLLITIHNHPELNSRPTVTAEGLITAPLVGDVDAVGLTPRELEVRLTEMLGRSYLVDPQVDVEVEAYRSQWVMVTGQVTLPQQVFLHGGTRLKEVLSLVGGFTDEAGETITVSRKDKETGEYSVLRIERRDFESGAQNPALRNGDIVDVSRAKYCYLQGEVRQPGRVQIERGMTLLRAVALVGGLTEWADRKSVRILFEEGTVPPETVVNLKRIQTGKDADLRLEGGEVIVVKRRFF